MQTLLGHLHPVIVHLPIGILLLACFFQLLSAKEKYIHLQHAISITLCWGMISAIASCVTGYLLSGSGDYDEDLVNKHQWLGITVAVLSTLYYFLYRYRLIVKYKWTLPVLLIVLIAVTGHLGGSLTHGSDYLTAGFENILADDTIQVRKPIADVQQVVAYTDIIQPIFQNKCYGCHGAHKQKGKFRMDEPGLLMKGGKDGILIKEGNPGESELIKRISLESADEHHMPLKEKPQLTEKEITLLHWWIATGASFSKKTVELPQGEKIKPVLLSLQNSIAEKKETIDVPLVPVEKANEKAIEKLQQMGVVIIPVATGSNYLSASLVSVPGATDRDVQFLLPLKKQLVWLKLSDTKITDAAAKIINQCINLSRLQLDSTGITDKGLADLKTLTQLQSLNLVGTNVHASGLFFLKDLPALRNIYVYKTGITGGDWAGIKKILPKVTIDTGGYVVPLFETDTMLVKPPVKVKQ